MTNYNDWELGFWQGYAEQMLYFGRLIPVVRKILRVFITMSLLQIPNGGFASEHIGTSDGFFPILISALFGMIFSFLGFYFIVHKLGGHFLSTYMDKKVDRTSRIGYWAFTFCYAVWIGIMICIAYAVVGI